MAKFSQQFLANLGRPQMAESLFGLGSAIGSLPGQAKAKAKQEQFNKIMDLANRAMVTNDPVNLGRARRQLQELGFTEEANKLTAAQMQAEQKQTATGMFQDALGQPRGFTPEQKAAYIAKGATPEQVEAASKAGIETMDPIRERARGRLRAMAKNKNFDTGNVRMLDAYLAQANKFFVSEDEAMKILSEERGTPFEREKLSATAGGRAGTVTFTEGGRYVDKRGLEYDVTKVRDPVTKDIELVYSPKGHEIGYAYSFKDPQTGKIVENRATFLGGAYGETASQRTDRLEREETIKTNLDITKADIIKESDNFSDLRMKAAPRLQVEEGTLADVNDLLEIVEVIDQGGSLVPLMNNIERVLGTEETDPGKLRIIAKELLVGRIKSFGANPTEGERQYLEQLIPALENSKGVNRAILERLKERLGREKAAIQYMFTEEADLNGYINYVNALYSADTGPDAQPTGNKVVDFNSI